MYLMTIIVGKGNRDTESWRIGESTFRNKNTRSKELSTA